MLNGKKIILNVTGSIAAYKAVYLLRLLKKEGCIVRVIMTESAVKFVSPLTFSTLSGDRVMSGLSDKDEWENHAILGRWADLILVAPATCNTIAAMANGFCNDLLTAVYLSATCPVMIAPAMDEDMWQHPATRRNIQRLLEDEVRVLHVNRGELASGLSGMGRMEEPEEIVSAIHDFFGSGRALNGKKVLVTAGPTIERIDPVRYITNDSSGKMGISIARAFMQAGAEVTLVCGPVHLPIPGGILTKKVQSAAEMLDASIKNIESYDIIVMAAAVADYTPINELSEKMKKSDKNLILTLQPTNDILATAGKMKRRNQLLVGFALETSNEEENAKKKLLSKNADFIILNSLNDEGAGFGTDTNKITIFGKGNGRWDFPLKNKQDVARDIVKFLSQHL